MKNIFNYNIAFLSFFFVLNVEACNKDQALKAAHQYVVKDSPAGSKVSLMFANDGIRYTATLLDDLGSYTGSGKLKVSAGKKGNCEVESIQRSASNLYNSGASNSIQN